MTGKSKNKTEKAKRDLLKAGGMVSDLLVEVAPDLVQEMADDANKAADFLQDKMTLFHVILWETREVVKSVENLNYAKKWARGRGHTGEDNPGLTSYPPLAYVANDNGDLVYNPRFGKNVSPDAGGLINAQPSSHF